ncbi:MAG TPA: M20/M25/M40 family metallo-hydrolase [Anaerolineaceae bacterium]|nr:M20/M25/M40 family metallo-hydrolase [Anaerolineaceae bacterium]
MDIPTPKTIADIFFPYIHINSESGTASENLAGAYVHQFVASLPYFQVHLDQFGTHAIAGDPLQRGVVWALVRGRGKQTVVLIHHIDVVEIEDYGPFKELAFSPRELEAALRQNPAALHREAREDLTNGTYFWGRGTADMKGGGAIQMAILAEVSRAETFNGNLLLLAVPDEENLSTGARSAAALMAELKTRLGLNYVLMINSEPHQRKAGRVGILSGGSIGKIMPFVYVRGILAHGGKSPEGFNPLAILSDVVRRTEMSLDLAETRAGVGEMSPPPTWLMVRDSKAVYDVSMPLSAFGCLSLLTLSNRPQQVLSNLQYLCETAAADMTSKINQAADIFHQKTGRSPRGQRWESRVFSFESYLNREISARGAAFKDRYLELVASVTTALQRGELSAAAATWTILDQITQLDETSQPIVIVGLLPPFYPSVSHLDRPEYGVLIQGIGQTLDQLAQERWGQRYELEAYFTGISDLSYSSLSAAPEVEPVISRNMPLYGRYYSLPFDQISEISMPGINIGPWGKDFHKLTERVLKEDLLECTPALVMAAIQTVLGNSCPD